MTIHAFILRSDSEEAIKVRSEMNLLQVSNQAQRLIPVNSIYNFENIHF